MGQLFQRGREFLFQRIWHEPLGRGAVRDSAVRLLRLAIVLARDFSRGRLNLHAMGLVYTTLLSLVPLLAVSFSVLKGFGVHNQIEPLLLNFLEPLGDKGDELTQNILTFVDNINIKVLGFVGVGFLLFTVVSLLQKIESAFNDVWRAGRARSFGRRFTDYFSVIMVGPILVVMALGVTATFMDSDIVQAVLAVEPFGTLMVFASKVTPYLLVIIAFSFVYKFVPNTHVTFRAALIGGVVGGVLWQTSGTLFAGFGGSSTRYSAIYSGFAIMILFMIWIYLSWLILLVGAQVAYYTQYPEQIRLGTGRLHLSNRLRERLGLLLVVLITRRFIQGQKPFQARQLAERLDLPGETIQRMLDLLVRAGVLQDGCEEEHGYTPAREPYRMQVKEVIDLLRRAEEDSETIHEGALADPEVDTVIEQMEQNAAQALEGLTVGQLSERPV